MSEPRPQRDFAALAGAAFFSVMGALALWHSSEFSALGSVFPRTVAVTIILLSIAAAYGLVALGLHPGWAFLIVAGAYLLVAAVLGLVGKRAVGKVGAPERTIRTSKDTAAFLKSPRSGDAKTPAG